MKILYNTTYFPSIEHPNSSLWIYELIEEFSKFYTTKVICPTIVIPNFLRNIDLFKRYPKYSKDYFKYNEINVIRPGYIKLPGNLFNDSYRKSITNIFNNYGTDFKPDIIHAHFGQNGSYSTTLKSKLSKSLITSFYGYDVGKIPQFHNYKELINNGDHFLALSVDMKNDLIKLGFPEEKIKVHHIGLKLDQYNNVKITSEKNKFIYLIVARFYKRKGIEYVIEAYAKLNLPDCELRIVGEGPEYKNYCKLISKLKLEKQITFINNFNYPNPKEIILKEIKNCDVFLLTSITVNGDKEGTPIVLMEAHALGKPCIATKHAGIPEIVLDNKTGILVRERNTDELVEAMKFLYVSSDHRYKLGNEGANHIKRNFNSSKQNRKLEEIYKSLT